MLLADEPTGNLDSRTNEELLQMFQQLNGSDGITIILVTHDPGVAQHARRTVYIKDGLIEKSTIYVNPGITHELVWHPENGPECPSTQCHADNAYHPWHCHQASRAVITMTELGNGATISIQRTMASMGANTLVGHSRGPSAGGVNMGFGSMMTLTPQDADAIIKECPAVRNVAPIVRARTQLVFGNRNYVPTYLYGTTPSFLDIRDWTELDMVKRSPSMMSST